MSVKPVICVGVCTLQRPVMLANCLKSLAAQENVTGLDLHLIVVDNDAVPSSERIVTDFAKNCPFPLHYHHEPRRGIPMARNRVLTEALALRADRLAFIDDDQIATPTFIFGHMEAAARHGADVIQPDIVTIYPDPPPFWSTGVNRDPATIGIPSPGEGVEQKSAGTGGVMLSSWLFRPDGLGLRFEERLALAGGEDAEFFNTAYRSGARIVWSALPVIMEEAHRSRLTYSRYIMRGLARGGQLFAQYRHKNGYRSALRKYFFVFLVRGLRGIGQLAISPIFLPFDMRQFKFTALEGGRNIFLAAGAIGGAFSIQYEYYRRIDGY